MEYARLGNSDLNVSRICLGTVFRSERDEKTCVAAIHEAAEFGCNYLDCANIYRDGVSEEFVGRAIRGRRHEFVVSTKVGASENGGSASGRLSRDEITRAAEASLRRLDTDFIDTYLCHFPDLDTPLEETLRALDGLVQRGKVRHVGVSNFEGWRLTEALSISERKKLASPVCNQLGYSLLDRRIEEEVVPICRDQSVAVTVFASTAIGLLSGRYRHGQPPPPGTSWHRGPYNYRAAMTEKVDHIIQAVVEIATAHDRTPSQIAMAWCLAQPGITSVITGADTVERVRENCAAVDVQLTGDELDRLDRLTTDHCFVFRKDCPGGYDPSENESSKPPV